MPGQEIIYELLRATDAMIPKARGFLATENGSSRTQVINGDKEKSKKEINWESLLEMYNVQAEPSESLWAPADQPSQGTYVYMKLNWKQIQYCLMVWY